MTSKNIYKLGIVLNKIVEIFCYGLIFAIPISTAPAEIFSGLLIFFWLIKQSFYLFFRNIVYIPTQKNASLKINNIKWPIILFFTVTIISMLFSKNIALSLRGAFLKTAEHILLFYIFFKTFSRVSERKFKIILCVITFSALLIFSDALFQWFTGKDFIRGNISNIHGRLSASFGNPNGLAGWLIVMLPMLITIVIMKFGNYKTRMIKLVKVFISILVLVGIVVLTKTMSKGAWFGFCFSFFIMMFFSLLLRIGKRKNTFVIFSCILIVTVAVGFILRGEVEQRINLIEREVGQKVNIRETLWKEACCMIKNQPLLGTGPNTYNFVAPKYKLTEYSGTYPHNSYLQMAAEIGLIGLCSFLWILYSFFSKGIRALKKYRDPFLLGVMGGLTASLAHSFFDVNLFSTQLVILFWVVLGLGMARIKNLERDNEQDRILFKS